MAATGFVLDVDPAQKKVLGLNGPWACAQGAHGFEQRKRANASGPDQLLRAVSVSAGRGRRLVDPASEASESPFDAGTTSSSRPSATHEERRADHRRTSRFYVEGPHGGPSTSPRAADRGGSQLQRAWVPNWRQDACARARSSAIRCAGPDLPADRAGRSGRAYCEGEIADRDRGLFSSASAPIWDDQGRPRRPPQRVGRAANRQLPRDRRLGPAAQQPGPCRHPADAATLMEQFDPADVASSRRRR